MSLRRSVEDVVDLSSHFPLGPSAVFLLGEAGLLEIRPTDKTRRRITFQRRWRPTVSTTGGRGRSSIIKAAALFAGVRCTMADRTVPSVDGWGDRTSRVPLEGSLMP